MLVSVTISQLHRLRPLGYYALSLKLKLSLNRSNLTTVTDKYFNIQISNSTSNKRGFRQGKVPLPRINWWQVKSEELVSCICAHYGTVPMAFRCSDFREKMLISTQLGSFKKVVNILNKYLLAFTNIKISKFEAKF